MLSWLGGFAGMQMGATVQQQLNPKPNTTQANQQATSQGASGGKVFELKNPKSFEGSSIRDIESYLDDALKGYTKTPLIDGNGVRYFDGKGNSCQLNYGYNNATDAVHGGEYLKTTVGSEKMHIPLMK